MTRTAVALAALCLAGFASQAKADGYPPFYGYSTYFGGPAVYFTPENDVQQATTMYEGEGKTRTYYRGGPFYGYKSVARRSFSSGRRHHRRAVVRARG